VNDAGLHRPRTEPIDRRAMVYGDGEILMPRHRPVRVRRLVEEYGANCERFRREHLLNELPNRK